MVYSGGITLPGIGIFVNYKQHGADLRNLLLHEYGHILQSNKFGKDIFYGHIGAASLISAISHDEEGHRYFWTETSANFLAKKHFNYSAAAWNPGEYPYFSK